MSYPAGYGLDRPTLFLRNLRDLGRAWYLDLACNGDDWILTLTSRSDGSEHRWMSVDLERLVNHAWAGAPEGRC
jgi:hypothetical protein